MTSLLFKPSVFDKLDYCRTDDTKCRYPPFNGKIQNILSKIHLVILFVCLNSSHHLNIIIIIIITGDKNGTHYLFQRLSFAIHAHSIQR